jgi:hypothetical protein
MSFLVSSFVEKPEVMNGTGLTGFFRMIRIKISSLKKGSS